MRQGFYKRLRKIKHLHFKEVRVQIMPTFLCSQNCAYCTRHFTGKMTVKKDEHQLSAKQWIQRMEEFPLQVDIVKFELPSIAHCFKKGHRMMVQVQSSWFTLVDRNPQQFVDIYYWNESDFIKSEIKIYHEKNKASKIILPVLN